MTITNNASWIEQCEGDFVVKETAYHNPGPGEVVVKNAAVALNPRSLIDPRPASSVSILT